MPKPNISAHVEPRAEAPACERPPDGAAEAAAAVPQDQDKGKETKQQEAPNNETEPSPAAATEGPASATPRKPTAFAANMRRRFSQSINTLQVHRPSREPKSQDLDPPDVSTAPAQAQGEDKETPGSDDKGYKPSNASPPHADAPQHRLSPPVMGEKVEAIFSQVKKRIVSATEAAVPLASRHASGHHRHGRSSSDVRGASQAGADSTAAVGTMPAAVVPAFAQQQQQETTAGHTPPLMATHVSAPPAPEKEETQQQQQQQPETAAAPAAVRFSTDIAEPAQATSPRPPTAPEVSPATAQDPLHTQTLAPITTTTKGPATSSPPPRPTTDPTTGKRRRQSLQIVKSLLSERLDSANPTKGSVTGTVIGGPATTTATAVGAPTPAHSAPAAPNTSADAEATTTTTSPAAQGADTTTSTTAASQAGANAGAGPSIPARGSSSSTPVKDTIAEKVKHFLNKVREARAAVRRAEQLHLPTHGLRRPEWPMHRQRETQQGQQAEGTTTQQEAKQEEAKNDTTTQQQQQQRGHAEAVASATATAPGTATSATQQAEGKNDTTAKPEAAPATTTFLAPEVQRGSDETGHGQGAAGSSEDEAKSDRATGGHGAVVAPTTATTAVATAVEGAQQGGEQEKQKCEVAEGDGKGKGKDEEGKEEQKAEEQQK